MPMKIRKTPAQYFDDLPDFDFAPNFVTLDDHEGGTLDMHYIEAGPQDGQPVVMIHGNPTWCFAWRKIVPQVAAAGFRVIAIDLIGMGRFRKFSRNSQTFGSYSPRRQTYDIQRFCTRPLKAGCYRYCGPQ